MSEKYDNNAYEVILSHEHYSYDDHILKPQLAFYEIILTK